MEGKEASLEMKSRWRERRVWWSVRSASLVTFAPDTSASTGFDFAAKSFVLFRPFFLLNSAAAENSFGKWLKSMVPLLALGQVLKRAVKLM